MPTGAIKPHAGLLHEDESLYQYIQVVERGDAHRLYLNEGIAVHSVWRADELLTGGVWDTFLALPPLLGRPAGESQSWAMRAARPPEPSGASTRRRASTASSSTGQCPKVGRRYFGLDDNPRLEVHTADARPFLRRTDERYDLIFVDAYRPPYVPFYLATREFFALAA